MMIAVRLLLTDVVCEISEKKNAKKMAFIVILRVLSSQITNSLFKQISVISKFQKGDDEDDEDDEKETEGGEEKEEKRKKNEEIF